MHASDFIMQNPAVHSVQVLNNNTHDKKQYALRLPILTAAHDPLHYFT